MRASPADAIPPDYTSTLATAIDRLLATSPEVGIAGPQLRAAAAEAGSLDPDADLIIRQLESAQDILYGETLIGCRQASMPDQTSDWTPKVRTGLSDARVGLDCGAGWHPRSECAAAPDRCRIAAPTPSHSSPA